MYRAYLLPLPYLIYSDLVTLLTAHKIMAMSPLPTLIPHSAADLQQLQLIQQVHNHTLPYWNMYILSLLLPLPGIPIEWKLGIYNFLTNIPLLSTLHLSTFWFGILAILGPLGIVILLALFIFIVVKLINNVIAPLIFLLLGKLGVKAKQEERALLELTFHQIPLNQLMLQKSFMCSFIPGPE